MMTGVGGADDLAVIQDALAQALGYEVPQDKYKIGERCKEIAAAHEISFKESEIRYASLVGYVWGAGEKVHGRLMDIMSPFWDYLSLRGKQFVESTLKGAMNSNLKNNCPLLCDILQKAIIKAQEAPEIPPGTTFYQGITSLQ